MNLTAHRDAESARVDLVEDSLTLVPLVTGHTLLDIGSGAGFPGLVLAAALPGLSVTLLEPRAKRVSWLKHAVRLLDLGARVRVMEGRAGEGAISDQPFATITLRAVAGLSESLALARPYLAPDGVILLPRGIKDRSAAESLGCRVIDYRLPDPWGPRIVVLAH